jgi:hypothetical protein
VDSIRGYIHALEISYSYEYGYALNIHGYVIDFFIVLVRQWAHNGVFIGQTFTGPGSTK